MKLQFTLPADAEQELKSQVRQWTLDVVHASEPKPEKQYPEYMTLGQAAKYMGMSRGTLTKAIKAGLKVTVFGGKRIRREDADQFMIAHSI
jgi:excisionase family DNA binding protein